MVRIFCQPLCYYHSYTWTSALKLYGDGAEYFLFSTFQTHTGQRGGQHRVDLPASFHQNVLHAYGSEWLEKHNVYHLAYAPHWISCLEWVYCLFPLTIIHCLFFPFFVFKMFEVVNNLRNTCVSIPVAHSKAIVSPTHLCCRHESKQLALKAIFLMSHAFWIIFGKPEGWHKSHVWISQIFISSLTTDEDWSFTGHVYDYLPVF